MQLQPWGNEALFFFFILSLSLLFVQICRFTLASNLRTLAAMSSPQERLSSISKQLSPAGVSAAKARILAKNPDDVVGHSSAATITRSVN